MNMENQSQTLRQRLKTKRVEHKLSQSEMAKIMGVKFRTYQGWETKNTPPLAACGTLDALEYMPDDMFALYIFDKTLG